MNHNVSDFIIRIKNAALAKRKEVILPFSNINKEIGKVLVKEGFLET
jgi:ribosomal protein S8